MYFDELHDRFLTTVEVKGIFCFTPFRMELDDESYSYLLDTCRNWVMFKGKKNVWFICIQRLHFVNPGVCFTFLIFLLFCSCAFI